MRPIVPLLSVALAAVALAGCGGSKKTSTTGVHYGALGDACAAPDNLCASPLACINFRCNSKPTKLHDACAPNTAPCPAGLGCAFGQCETLVTAAGGACNPSFPCADGLYCVGGQCANQLPPGGTCSPGSAPAIVKGIFTLDPTLEAKYAVVPPQTTADAAHCVLPVQPPVSNTGYTDIGTRTVGSRVTFSVPPGTTALTVVSQEQNQSAVDSFNYNGFAYPNSVVPNDVFLPSGTILYDDLALPGIGADPDALAGILAYYGASSVADGSFTVPNTSRAVSDVLAAGSLPDGIWSFTVNDYAYEAGIVNGNAGQYDVSVLARTAPLAASGQIDIAVYLVTRSGLTAAQAADPTTPFGGNFKQWAGSLAMLLGQLGICVGTVHVYDLPSDLQTLWYSINIDQDKPCDPLMQMFTVSQPVDAVHLFFVDHLDASGLQQGQQLAGIDGTIPGPSLFPGILNSGAAVALEDFFTNPGTRKVLPFDPVNYEPDYLAYIAAHETGHWLGLYHDTEADGMLFDPLTDTPTCPCSTCMKLTPGQSCGKGSAPPEVTAQMCAPNGTTGCDGGDNLMFWLYQDNWSKGNVTPQQGAVVRLNPAVH